MLKKRNWVEFEHLSLTEQRFRILNLSLMIVLFLTSISFLIHFFIIGDPNNRVVATIGNLILIILPYLFEIIFRQRLNNLLFFLYLVYLFFAGFLGCVLNFYNISFLNLKNWYDVFIHVLAGYSFCFLGMFVLARIEQYSKLSIWTIVLFAFVFTLAVELIWELLERFVDLYLGQSAQGTKVSGTNSPLLSDTLADIFCNFIGGIIFVIHYIVSKKTNFSLGIDLVENEIAYKGLIVSNSMDILREKKEKEKFKVDILLVHEEDLNKKVEKESMKQ